MYIQQPPGYEENAQGMACHLHRALYGLRQAPRAWHLRLKEELEAIGCIASAADPGLYILEGPHAVYILIYVDDMLIATKRIEEVQGMKTALMASFDARDLGEAGFFLGMAIERDRANRTIKLSQANMAAIGKQKNTLPILHLF